MFPYLIFIYIIALLIAQFYLVYKTSFSYTNGLFTKPLVTPKDQFKSLNDISLSDLDLESLAASVVVPGRIPKSITYLQYPILDSIELLVYSSDTVKMHVESFRFNKKSKRWFKSEITASSLDEYGEVTGSLLDPLFHILFKLPTRFNRYSVSFA